MVGRVDWNAMSNDPPTKEEVDRMEELYDELDSFKAVSEHEDIDYSRKTVSKWLKDRWNDKEQDEDTGSMDDDPFTAGPDDEPRVEADDGSDAASEAETTDEADPDEVEEEDFSDILVEEPPEPNEILVDVLENDPGIKEKHRKYVQSKFDQFGQMAPSDLVSTLNQVKITNKNQVIRRVKENYEQRINTRQRREDDITQYEPWATLFTKITGDPTYIQNANAEANVGGGSNIQAPPADSQPAADPAHTPTDGGVSPARPSGSHSQTARPDPNQQRATPAQQQGQQPTRGGGIQPPQPTQQSGEGLSEFEERLIGMLEEQMDDGGSGGQPEQTVQQPEPESPTDQIEELLTLQQKVEQLTGGDDGNDQDAQVEALIEQMQAQINALTEQVNNDDGQQAQPQTQSSGDGEMGMVEKMAVLSERVDDPEIIQAVMEMETDPEVLEAKAKREEIENDSAWKKELASALSPNAVEKGMEFLSKLTPQQAAQAATQPPAQPRQAQPAQPVQQQPQQAQQPQQQAQQGTDVQRAEPNPDPAVGSGDDSPETSSPLRETGKEKLADTEDDGSEDDTEEAAEADDADDEADGEE